MFIYIIFYILALKMASPGNQHSASCVGTLSFPVEAMTENASAQLVPGFETVFLMMTVILY